MHRTTHALTIFATAVLGAVTLAQEPQRPGASGQALPMDDGMRQCIEHCRTAGEQGGSQADDSKQSMGCMAMMGMQNMQDMPDMKNMPETNAMPGMKDMPGMPSGTRMDGSAGAPLQRSPKMATSVRELERVCGYKVDPRTAPKSTYNGNTYYFCSADDKTHFDQSPEQFVGERSRQEPREEGRQMRRRRC